MGWHLSEVRIRGDSSCIRLLVTSHTDKGMSLQSNPLYHLHIDEDCTHTHAFVFFSKQNQDLGILFFLCICLYMDAM